MTDDMKKTRAMLEKVEAVAIAMYKNEPELSMGKEIPWDNLTTRYKNAIRKKASVAIDALGKTEEPAQELRRRIAAALETADMYGNIDSGHHRKWAIDQMVRALCGCPRYPGEVDAETGVERVVHVGFQTNEEYAAFVAEYERNSLDPLDPYEWDLGIIP